MSKEIYVPEGGIAHKVTKVYAPVNGVATSMKKVYKGVNGVARLVFEALPPMAPVFADNTWSDIILACQRRAVPDTWAVGDHKIMTINGKGYLIDIIGKNHDDYADGSGKAPLTFQLHDCYATRYSMNSGSTNTGGWRDAPMRKTALPAILALMPAEVQQGVREVNKNTTNGGKSSLIVTTADKLFLLSEIEIFGNFQYSFQGEGSRYAYYAQGNTAAKTCEGERVIWWERSPYKDNTQSFCAVFSYGEQNHGLSSSLQYVAPAFCF